MRGRFPGMVVGISLAAATSARADAIDGRWCHDASQRLSINGPSIVTAAGTKTQGDYSRHAFAYVVPKGEPGAGNRVSMILLNEDTMQLRPGPQAPAETWLRCNPPVS